MDVPRAVSDDVAAAKSNRTHKIDCDFHANRWQRFGENLFCNLKAFWRIGTRYEKTDQSYRAMINLAVVKIALC